MPFGTSNFLMCHIFLIPFKCTFSCLNHIFPLIRFSSCVSFITVSLAMPSTTSNTSSQCHLSTAGISTTKQNNTSYNQSIGRQCLHPAAPCHQPLAPTSRSLLTACGPMLVLASAHRHLTPSQSPAAIKAPFTAQTK
jgi:hypothetical protein